MRRGAIVLAAALAGLSAAQACSAHKHSDDLQCDDPTDCTDGRQCVDGYCVFDDSFADAAVDADERCPSPCTSCSGLFDDAGGYATCIVDCSQNGSCDTEVVCPSGMECIVTCGGTGACADGVDCRNATGCAITCGGTGSCDGNVRCGDGPCTITCGGPNSCDNAVDCSTSCACDVTCNNNACDQGVTCPAAACETTTPVGCSSTQDPSCDTCGN